MGWPEWTLTGLQAVNLTFAAFTMRDVPKFAGTMLGLALVIFLLYKGGFYN